MLFFGNFQIVFCGELTLLLRETYQVTDFYDRQLHIVRHALHIFELQMEVRRPKEECEGAESHVLDSQSLLQMCVKLKFPIHVSGCHYPLLQMCATLKFPIHVSGCHYPLLQTCVQLKFPIHVSGCHYPILQMCSL
jgi:hypothetical protein